MAEDGNQIEEVVVTGYGNINTRKNTSAVTSLKMEDILQPGMTSLTDALNGRVPDMMFTQNSGEVGATARIRVRGTSTLIGNREPLWVLDGVQLTDPVDVTTEQLNDPDYVNYIGNAISVSIPRTSSVWISSRMPLPRLSMARVPPTVSSLSPRRRVRQDRLTSPIPRN